MTNFPIFPFKMREVMRAGEVISSGLLWTPDNREEILRAFQIANSWRDAHSYPMRSVRSQLVQYMRAMGMEGLTAARLKRMQAIRRKLRRVRLNLNQYQDLGGCRVILSNMADVRALSNCLLERSRHDLKENNYIEHPKPDGYRSHHLIASYKGKGLSEIYDDRKVEIQLRTRFQHSWATAVEAVGLFRGEELKSNQGSPDWLRLFFLMSAEIAEAENCPISVAVPDRSKRVKEIRELDKKLNASQTLENLVHTVRWDEYISRTQEAPKYYLIRYDRDHNVVTVEPYSNLNLAAGSYDAAEERGNLTDDETENIVLVEVDKIENLRLAYPNYFGDVQLFRQSLQKTVSGKIINELNASEQKSMTFVRESEIAP